MKVKIVRVEESLDGTFGVLLIDEKAYCVTLELPDANNRNRVSNIPPGVYQCEKTISQKFGQVVHVKDVPGRTGILFHPGNTTDDTLGCILLGQYFGKLRTKRAVLNSGETFKHFLNKVQNHFALEIIEA